MTTGSRLPTWKERENNRRRERRRREIAAKIYAGLRMFGNYTLPKHCDNNEVLKALCNEAGWIVEEDGTTYRKGCKPTDRMHTFGGSTSASPSSSYNPSHCASYNPSPGPSSIPSPVSSHYMTNNGDANSLIPWLKNLSSGSLSAPVTPPLSSSPTAQTPRVRNDPSRQILPDHHGWLNGVRVPQPGPTSPTFNLVSRNSFGFVEVVSNGGGSRMWTPVQSGTCSPVVADVPMSDCVADEFAFGSSINGRGLVKAWEGERIHEECGSDDLELTLGTTRTR